MAHVSNLLDQFVSFSFCFAFSLTSLGARVKDFPRAHNNDFKISSNGMICISVHLESTRLSHRSSNSFTCRVLGSF